MPSLKSFTNTPIKMSIRGIDLENIRHHFFESYFAEIPLLDIKYLQVLDEDGMHFYFSNGIVKSFLFDSRYEGRYMRKPRYKGFRVAQGEIVLEPVPIGTKLGGLI